MNEERKLFRESRVQSSAPEKHIFLWDMKLYSDSLVRCFQQLTKIMEEFYDEILLYCKVNTKQNF